MIECPKKKDKKGNSKLCDCRPVCKHRRRTWKGVVLKTSAELLAEKELKEEKPVQSIKIHPMKPCEKWVKSREIIPPVKVKKPSIVKICEAPIADTAATPFVEYAKLAKEIGAWDSVRKTCAFCSCPGCCACTSREYELGEEGAGQRRRAMTDFDRRVRDDCKIMRIMYNNI
ncbi:uncharacterized protein LOC106714342 [Papilio machaon]|uniref:uncharacterized protein LOC106714342 n=1 Tax=Papilio machaon TaxID=76193 RepID=UPI001E66435C|nr:uncharacterized protein LOC106714342 [Papilio machaon]